MTTTVPQAAGYELPTELIAAVDAVSHACEQSKRLREKVDSLAATLPELEADVQRLNTDLANLEADRALAPDDAVKGLDAHIKKLAADADSKIRELNRARNQLQALEARGPELDAKVREAGRILQSEVTFWQSDAVHALKAELTEAVKPLLGVMAKARALQKVAVRHAALWDFVEGAWVPDPENFIRIPGPSGFINQGDNLLQAEPDALAGPPAEAISDSLVIVQGALATAALHRDYVPLAKRPKPYVRKGYSMDGESFRAAGPTTGEPMGPKPLPPSAGFTRKHHSDGTPIDGEVAHQAVNNMMRNTGGSEFAV